MPVRVLQYGGFTCKSLVSPLFSDRLAQPLYLCFVNCVLVIVVRGSIKIMADDKNMGHPLQQTLEGWEQEGGQLTDLLVPAEFNHELFPTASTALHPTEELLTFTLETVLPDGRLVERTLEVEGSPRLGLPGLFDQEVYAGIMALVGRKGGMAPDGVLRFSLYELKEILGLPTNAENYRRLRESLLRWQRTSLTTQGAVYLADAEEYVQGQAYNIWSVQWTRDSRPGRAKTELNEVRFHEYFIRNYQAGYIKSIDWDFWLSLGRGKRGGTLKRLYRLIDVQRAGTLEWRTTVQRLMAQVPIPPSYKYPGKARDYLRRLHPHLVNHGFLESAEISNDYEVHYKVDPRFVSRQKHLELADDPRDRAAIERLISFRVRESTARHLVARRGAGLCQRYMDALPYQKIVQNKAGWLNTYIAGNVNGPFPPKYGFAPANDATQPEAELGSRTSSDSRSQHGSNPDEDYAWFFHKGDSTSGDLVANHTYDPQIVGSGMGEGPSPDIGEDVRRRMAAAEFDEVIDALESSSHAEYSEWVEASVPVVDVLGNRFYLSIGGDLYLYVGEPCPENRFYLYTINRDPDDKIT